MVSVSPRIDPTFAPGAAAVGDGNIAAQLEEALSGKDPQQLARALTALKAMSEKDRTNTLDKMDPAALQVLLDILSKLMQGSQPFGQDGQDGGAGQPPSMPQMPASAASAPRASGGAPSMPQMPSMPSMPQMGGMPGLQPRPSVPGASNPGATARHAPVTQRTNGLNRNDPAPAMPGGGRTPGKLREKHQAPANNAQLRLSPSQQRDSAAFKRNFEQNRSRYEAVAQRTNMPPELIAALHWRESSGNFNTYLHQGDPLGRPATHVPRNIPVFHKWEDSAVHALGQKAGYQRSLGLTKDSTDKASMAAYAELYNGLGYHYRNQPSPYVYSGTDKYSSGKYVADGVYNPRTVDSQLGVLALMQSLR